VIFKRQVVAMHNWTLQQDGARHTTLTLHQKNITFIERDVCQPKSLDLNPVDYAIWGALQEKVYLRQKFTLFDQLKLALVEEWRKLAAFYLRKHKRMAPMFGKIVVNQGTH
jgi:hypothetical protein